MKEHNMNSAAGAETAVDNTPDPARIRELNDTFRQSFTGGRVVMTAGVGALSERVREAVIAAVRAFDSFTVDDDPYREHDFGAVEIEGERCLWKIDAYDRSLRLHSPDAADPTVTVRVLTLMLAEEY